MKTFINIRTALVPVLLVLVFAHVAVAQQSMNGIRLQDANSHVVTISGPTAGFSGNYNFRFPTAMPSTGALFYSSDAAGQSSWLPAGTNGQILSFSGGLPVWANLSTLLSGLVEWDLSGNAISSAYNGLLGNFLGTTNNQPLVIATTNILTPQPIEFFTNNAEKMRLTSAGELGIGLTPTSGKLLHVNGTAGTSNVRLASLASATGTTGRVMFATDATGDLQSLAFPASAGLVLTSTTTGALSWISPSTGSVTSVGLSMPSIFAVANSPITTSGTLTATLATEAANTIFAGPTTGAAAAPTFRALVAADIPSLDASKITTGTLTPAVGGTGLNTSATPTGSILYTTAAGTWGTLPVGGAGQVLTLSAGIPSWASLSATDWQLVGNSVTTAYNGATGSFIGTTNTQPMVVATTNTTTAQPIEFFTNNVEQARISATGNLGVGTTAPVVAVDIARDLATRELNYVTSFANGSTNNNMSFDGLTPSNQTSLVRLAAATGPFTVTGVAGGQSGKFLTINNVSGQTMTIANLSGSSLAANQIMTGAGSITIPSGGTANLQYSGTDAKWVVRSVGGAALSSTSALFARKTANVTFSANSTLTADADLSVALAANATYEFSGVIAYNGATASSDLQIAFSIPAGATIRWSVDQAGTSFNATSITGNGGITSAVSPFHTDATAANNLSIFVSGIVITAGTAGNLQVYEAQATSSAVNTTTILQNSHLRGLRVQ